VEAFVLKCEAFVKNTMILKTFSEKLRFLFRNVERLVMFEDFFKEIEAFSWIARLFTYIFSEIKAFLK
jgi:hypothetical protein